MQHRRLAAGIGGAVTAALLMMPGVAAGAQADERSLVRLAHFAPGLLKGDVLVANARFTSVSDYQEVPAGSVGAEVRKTWTGEVLAKAGNVKLASGSSSSLVAVGGIGEKTDLLVLNDAAAAVAAAGGVATGAGGTAPSSPGGRRFALTLLIGCGLAAATGFIVQQRRSSG